MVKCKVSEVISLGPDHENPVLVDFQNGDPKADPVTGRTSLEFLVARARDSKRRHALVAHADNAYIGPIVASDEASGHRQFIGIRNRLTNKMRLIEVEQASVLGSHYQTGVASATAGPPKAPSAEDVQQTYRKMLKSFGGKAAIRMLEKKEKMRLNVDIVKEQLDKTVDESLNGSSVARNADGDPVPDAFDEAKANREEAHKSMLPKLNESATRLQDVYELTDLIADGLLQSMDSDALSVVRTSLEDLPIKSAFLQEIVRKVQKDRQPESPDNLRRIKICIYIDALIGFLKGVRNTRLNMVRTDFSDIAERVENDIRKNFRQPDTLKIIKTNYIQHKIILYIVILSLLASDTFEIDVNELVAATNTSKSQLYTLTSIVAVRRKAKSDVLMLKLPSQLRSLARPAFAKSRRNV